LLAAKQSGWQGLSAYVPSALNQHVENLVLIDGTPEVHRQFGVAAHL
jgi:hypothetical protein